MARIFVRLKLLMLTDSYACNPMPVLFCLTALIGKEPAGFWYFKTSAVLSSLGSGL